MKNTFTQISRRDFLYLSVIAAAAGVTSGCRLFSAGDGSPLDQALAAVDAQAAQVVSKALITQDAKFADRAHLEEALQKFSGTELKAQGDTSGSIAHAIVADFRTKRTVAVSGWVLSLTEAQVVALKALSRSRT